MKRLVQYPEYGKNTPYLVDFIQICLAAKFLNVDEIRALYVDKGLSVNQIASHFKVSRTVILSRLHDIGIREEANRAERMTNPENYRCSVTPYGFMVRAGKLVPNRTEMKICRLVVELAQRQGRSHNSIAQELSCRGFKNRAGNPQWNSRTVHNIYKRWKDKL